MRERERELLALDIFNVGVAETRQWLSPPGETWSPAPARDKDLMPVSAVTQICSLTWDNLSWQDWGRESRRGELGVLPYLKQQRKLNFLVGKNIQLWLANLQTRCKHVVCCLWAVRAVLVLTVSIKLETLPKVRHYLIDLSRCEPIDTAESQSHLAFSSCRLPIFKVGDIKLSGILLQNTGRLELFSRARDPTPQQSTAVNSGL